MQVIILGAAAGGGFPQWNSACPVGARAWAGDRAASWRNQCSLAVSDDGERWTLLNAAPEIRHQILATPELHPKESPRHSPISSVVLTNGDIDHVAGLLTLRESQPFKLFATTAILDVLAANPIFNALNPAFVERSAFRLDEDLDTGTGLSVRPFSVPGKVPLYMEGEEVEIGGETEDTIGLEVIGSNGASFFFIPGCAAVTPALAERIRGAALLLFDGTLWIDDEMRRGRHRGQDGRAHGPYERFRPEWFDGGAWPFGNPTKDLSSYQQHQPDPAGGFARAGRGRGCRLRGCL